MTRNWLLMTTIIMSSALAAQAADSEKQSADRGFEMFIAESTAAPGLQAVTVEDGTEKTVYLHQKPFLTGEHVASAEAVQDERGRPAITITLDEVGKQAMAKATGESLPTPNGRYKKLAILVDGKVLCAPRILSKIGAKAQITGNFTRQEADALAAKFAK